MIKRKLLKILNEKGIFNNSLHIVMEKIFRFIINFAVFACLARSYGKDQFGALSYYMAIIYLLDPIWSLGTTQIARGDFAQSLQKKFNYINSLISLKLIMSSIVVFGIFMTAIISGNGVITDQLSTILIILSFGYFFRSTDIIEFWFDSKLSSKYSSIAKSIGFFISSTLKLIAIYTGAPLYVIATCFTLEFLFTAIFIVYFFYSQENKLPQFKLDKQICSSIFARSLPLLSSEIGFTLFNRIDQIFLAQYLPEGELGKYSAAAKIAELWYFLPASIAISYFSGIVSSSKHDLKIFNQKIRELYFSVSVLAILIFAPLAFFSSSIINLAYGEGFQGADQVLTILSGASFLAFWGFAQEPWDISKSFLKFRFYRVLAGTLINIVLNIIFIPKYGILAAAYTTLAAHLVTYSLINLTHKETRYIIRIQLESLKLWKFKNVLKNQAN